LSSSTAYAKPTALALDAPTPSEESEAFASRVVAVETFFSQPRFAGLSRPYSAAAVASKQGSLPPLPLPSTLLADKLYAIFDRAAKEGKPVHTLGAVDPVQMTQMARWLEVVYVSGWAASSLLTTANNEVGPDLGWVAFSTGFMFFFSLLLNMVVSTFFFSLKKFVITAQRLPIHNSSESGPSPLSCAAAS